MRTFGKMINWLLSVLGLNLYTAYAFWVKDPGFNEVRRHVRVNKIKGNPDNRCFFLYKLAIRTSKLEGDIAECGCKAGKSTSFLLAGSGADSGKTVHIFDSFEGVSEPSSWDNMPIGYSHWKKGALASPENLLLKNLQKYKHRIAVYRGWIPERFNEVSDRQFSIVHIDVDLYEPTLASLEFFYPRMVSGGVIVCDDYGSHSCPGAKKAFDDFFANRPEVLIEMPSIQAIAVKS